MFDSSVQTIDENAPRLGRPHVSIDWPDAPQAKSSRAQRDNQTAAHTSVAPLLPLHAFHQGSQIALGHTRSSVASRQMALNASSLGALNHPSRKCHWQ